MKIVKHKFDYDHYGSKNWRCEIEYNDKIYTVIIEYNPGWDKTKKGYYMGYLKNTKYIDHIFDEPWLVFGFSNYKETCKYILESIKKVIKGDYSKIKGVGHCISTPTDY